MFRKLSYKNIFWIQIGWVVFLRIYNTLIPDPFLVTGGFGWDGVAHYRPMLLACHLPNFLNSLDQYYIKKIFPFCFINRFLVLFFDNIDDALVLQAMTIWNFFAQIASIIVYREISKFHKFKKEVYFLGFVFLFVNWSFAKEVQYNIVLHTATLLFFSLLIYYAYITNKILLLGFIAFLLTMTWPPALLPITILLLVPKNASLLSYNKITPRFVTITASLSYILLCLLLIYFSSISPPSSRDLNFSDAKLTPLSIILSCALLYPLIYFVFKGTQIPTISAIKKHFRGVPKENYFFVLFTILCPMFLSSMASPTKGFSISDYVKGDILGVNTAYPLLHLVSPFFYYGLVPLFVFLFYRHIIDYVRKQGTGLTLLFIIGLLFALEAESRPFIFMLIFLTIPLLLFLNQFQLASFYVLVIAFINLLISRFYLNIYYIANNFFKEDLHNADGGFPLNVHRIQLFISNYGRWTSPAYYYTYFFIFLITLGFLFYLNKKYILNTDRK